MDRLTKCKHCESDACFESIINAKPSWYCFTCGYKSSTLNTITSPFDFSEFEKGLPEIVIDNKFIDNEGYVWYPYIINDKTMGMIFPEGTNKLDWEWKSIKYVDGNLDMDNATNYHKLNYMDALEFIGYFNKR